MAAIKRMIVGCVWYESRYFLISESGLVYKFNPSEDLLEPAFDIRELIHKSDSKLTVESVDSIESLLIGKELLLWSEIHDQNDWLQKLIISVDLLTRKTTYYNSNGWKYHGWDAMPPMLDNNGTILIYRPENISSLNITPDASKIEMKEILDLDTEDTMLVSIDPNRKKYAIYRPTSYEDTVLELFGGKKLSEQLLVLGFTNSKGLLKQMQFVEKNLICLHQFKKRKKVPKSSVLQCGEVLQIDTNQELKRLAIPTLVTTTKKKIPWRKGNTIYDDSESDLETELKRLKMYPISKDRVAVISLDGKIYLGNFATTTCFLFPTQLKQHIYFAHYQNGIGLVAADISGKIVFVSNVEIEAAFEKAVP